jgi:RES domain-containing protein
LSGGHDANLAAGLAISSVDWLPCHRLIASRFPTVGLYDQVASPEDLDVVFAIEALTNPRVRQELGQLSLVPPADRVAGAGATLIMAAFTHLNPLGSRFSDGSWGVNYAAASLETAVAEVSHHRAAFLARTAEEAIDIDLRWIQADLVDKLHELRGQRVAWPAVYDPSACGASQALGRALRAQGSAGIAYDSVRHPQGQCVAIFKPRALSKARVVGNLGLHWDGRAITHWFEKGTPHVL